VTLAELRERAEWVEEIREKLAPTVEEIESMWDFEDRAPALVAALCRVVEVYRAYYSGPMSEEDAEDWDNAIHEEQANLDALLREVDDA
jgi:hypothetical protein